MQEPLAGWTGTVRRETSDDAIMLGLLDAVERDPAVTQRSVARELGIALGLANAYLKRCVRKGLIKVSTTPARRYAYYLTPQGFSEKSQLTARYLANSFSFFRRARVQCAELFAVAAARGQRRLALIGDGDLAEIARLVAREHPVEIVAILPLPADGLRDGPDGAAIDAVDAVMITALSDARAAYDAALAAFGAERVHLPALLRVHAAAIAAARHGAAS
ncbi:MAG TPA: winged helix-turn-helix transcriptional regulator [Xanthobacteraceae bacterium]|nr:winged helix-turn-helix transcriptional regulator [Xanthobacteraceae bacterium]